MKYVLIALLLIALAAPAGAQTATATPTIAPTPRPGSTTSPDCGNGLPCGPIPWPLPNFVYLPSPTRFPTIVVTATPSPTSAYGTVPPTSGAIVSPTLPAIGGVGDQLATLEFTINSTSIPLSGDQLTANELGTDAGEFFGTLKGISELHLGPFTPLIVFLFGAFLYVMAVQASGLILPLLVAIFGFIRRLVSTILDFLPL